MQVSSFRLLTFNTFLRPPPIKTNKDDYKNQRFEDILQQLHRYHIVCFQELFQAATFRLEHLIEFAINHQFYYWKSSDPPSFGIGPVIDSGLLIISKFPIVQAFFESYGIGILSDSASDKGYIYCKIKINQSFLHLFATHLQASYRWSGRDMQRQLSVKVRLHQLKMLANRIHSHLQQNAYQKSDLVMLVGDLNIDSRQKPFILMNQSYLQGEGLMQLLNNESFEFNEYRTFRSIFEGNNLGLQDHVLQHYGDHPITFGQKDTVLTGPQDVGSNQSLDYIFTIRPPHGQNSHLKVNSSSCVVEKFQQKGKKYTQLSDHYGLSIEIVYQRSESARLGIGTSRSIVGINSFQIES